jgi:hypothetical protein
MLGGLFCRTVFWLEGGLYEHRGSAGVTPDARVADKQAPQFSFATLIKNRHFETILIPFSLEKDWTR